MLPNEKFKFEQQTKDGKRSVLLHGVIDEDTKFEELAKVTQPLIFNFRNIKSINSCGVRNWVNFVKELSHMEVCYEECPPLIVRQMNMVPSFQGHANVLSVFVPYVCDSCETEKLVLVPSEEFAKKGKNMETCITCEACGKEEMELDGHPAQYFAFAK